MSSVWDDPETDADLEEVTPLPEADAVTTEPALPLSPEKLEALTTQVVEKVVREVVPEIAERLIREKLEEILEESQAKS